MPAPRRGPFATLLRLATIFGLAGPLLTGSLSAQTLTGTVHDSTRAGPLAGATVVVSGTDRTAVTDASGRFRLEGLAPGEYVVGFFHPRLDTLGVAPRGRSVRLRAGETTEIALAVPSSATIAAASGPQRVRIDVRRTSVVVGRVLDAGTGAPVRGAAVRLRDSGFEALTDTLGWFAFPEVSGGDYLLEVEHIAYGTQSDSLAVPPERTVEVVFRASAEAIALEPLEVTVLSEADRLRRSSGLANRTYITREEIEEYDLRGAIHVGDALRMHKPNAVRIRPFGSFNDVCIESSRRVSSPGGAGAGGCRMVTIVVDGIIVYRPGAGGRGVEAAKKQMAAATLRALSLDAIESIEYLPGAAATMRYGTNVDAAVLITTVSGAPASDPRSGREIAAAMREQLELSEQSSRWKHWVAGGALGAGLGVGYVVGRSSFFERCEAGQCPDRRPAEIALSMAVGAAVGWLGGEIVYRLRR